MRDQRKSETDQIAGHIKKIIKFLDVIMIMWLYYCKNNIFYFKDILKYFWKKYDKISWICSKTILG